MPQFPFVAFEIWEKVTPFVSKTLHSSALGRRTPITDAKFTGRVDEVKKLGGDGEEHAQQPAPTDQTQIALFWLESSPLKWSRIARTVATEKEFRSVAELRGCSPSSIWP